MNARRTGSATKKFQIEDWGLKIFNPRLVWNLIGNLKSEISNLKSSLDRDGPFHHGQHGSLDSLFRFAVAPEAILTPKVVDSIAPTWKPHTVNIRIRQAISTDISVLRDLIEASVRGLQAKDYSPSQINSALATVFGVDTQLIADGTYFVAENVGAAVPVVQGAPPNSSIVGCGGWSKRKTLYGGDQWSGREAALLNPQHDAAKIRAFFIHPQFARRGIGTMILEACENAAQAAGFIRFEMGATLTGVPLYLARGYVVLENLEVPLANGETLPIVRMEKRVR